VEKSLDAILDMATTMSVDLEKLGKRRPGRPSKATKALTTPALQRGANLTPSSSGLCQVGHLSVPSKFRGLE
jgi:hypothetical protein